MTSTAHLRALLEACPYEPIEAYALIGDCRSAALVSRSGSIDWLCLPDFSAPSVFAAMLDRQRGGRFLIRPRGLARVERGYVGHSAVIATRFLCAGGSMSLTDFMSTPDAAEEPHRLFRLLVCDSGEVEVDIVFQPRPDYARIVPTIRPDGPNAWVCADSDPPLLLQADVSLEADDELGLLHGSCRLSAGESRRLVFVSGRGGEDPHTSFERARDHLRSTLDWWENWSGQCTYDDVHAAEVMRSCLTLKLLSHLPSGAVIAAATTSLPESFEAERNWDYRYCWLRDASLLLHAFNDLGFKHESKAFLEWLLDVGRAPQLQPFYGLDAQEVPEETVLEHLEGYRGCAPVRVGNAARDQLQLDIFGEVMQTACAYVSDGGRLSESNMQLLASLGETVCRMWREPDLSIWEPRNEPRHYTYSKMKCWVALDRLLGLHRHVALDIPVARFERERALIREAIETHGFNADLGSYVGYFGGTAPDASLLLMVPYGYSDPDDPRARGTYRYIMDRLATDGLLYRYPPGPDYDGIEGEENHFVACSFWAVDHLACSGRIDEAEELFDRLLGRANDVGLYPEQFDVDSGQARGNFPQAFSHTGLIVAALSIHRARGGRRGHPSLCEAPDGG